MAWNWTLFLTPPHRPSGVLLPSVFLSFSCPPVHITSSCICSLLGSCLETGPFGGSMSLGTTARLQPRFTSSPLLVKLVQVRRLKPPFLGVVRVWVSVSKYFSARVAQPLSYWPREQQNSRKTELNSGRRARMPVCQLPTVQSRVKRHRSKQGLRAVASGRGIGFRAKGAMEQ